MPDKVIDIPGLGPTAFPDSMSDGDIDTAAAKLYREANPNHPPPDPQHSWVANAVEWTRGAASDAIVGAAKGAAQTATNLGSLVHKIPGVTPAVDALYGQPGLSDEAFKQVNTALEPTNTAQRLGKAGEQIAEVIVPGRAIAGAATTAAARVPSSLATAARVGVEAAGNAGISAAQGGNPLVGGAMGAAAPLVGDAARALPTKLRESAEQGVMQALGPTKDKFKAMAERLTPEILRRGLHGSREALQAQAADAAEVAGQRIDDALTAFGSQQVGTRPVIDALETAKQAFQTTTPTGKVVIFEPRAVKQLEGLQKVITDLGPDATVTQLVAIRRAWDKVVDQAGGFAHRAGGAIGVPLKDQSEAWAKREATGAIRQLLDAEVPDLTAVNREFSFWKSLDRVLTQTLQRTQPQGPSLGKTIAEAGGQALGGLAASPAGPGPAVAAGYSLGKVAALAKSVFTSPRWHLASAQMKDKLAETIATGNVSQIATALARVGAVQASKIPAGRAAATP